VAARLIAGATARLNRVTESLAATLPGVTFLASLELLGEDETRRAHGYARGAEALTPALTAILATSAHPRSRGLRTDETERQHAVDRLGILDSDPDPRFDTLAQQAALLLHMSAAAITFADRDRQWIKSAVGLEASDLPRAGSLCDITLVTTGAFCVDDIRVRRPELGQRTQVMDAVGLVSYAGYPLEDAAGVPIGTLCVADTAPHRFTAQDIALLRGLALQAQALLTAPVAESPRLA
jgi:GAF domain-containing protein